MSMLRMPQMWTKKEQLSGKRKINLTSKRRKYYGGPGNKRQAVGKIQ